MMASWRTSAAWTLVLALLLVGGLVLVAPGPQPASAHEQSVLVPASGTGRCPSDVQNCTSTWTHVNSWTHYTARVPSNCSVDIIDQCGIRVTSTSATSSCQSSSNCGHGPHSSTPQPTGPGTWTRWNGHRNANYRWSGQRRQPMEHEHDEEESPPLPKSPGAISIHAPTAVACLRALLTGSPTTAPGKPNRSPIPRCARPRGEALPAKTSLAVCDGSRSFPMAAASPVFTTRRYPVGGFS